MLFNRAINYHPRAEVWLLKTEYCAQETIGKLIGHAVSSFPKQPLDEWIIDYPQQTILSTIHLILTHEINEMLHDMRAARGTEGPSMTHTGQSETLGAGNETSQIDTRSIQQLQETSRLTSNLDQSEAQVQQTLIEEITEKQEEDKESDKAGEGDNEGEGENSSPKKEVAKQNTQGNNILLITVDPKNEDKNGASQPPPGGRLTLIRKQEEEAKEKEMEMKLKEDKDQYIIDMFGPSFDIQSVTEGQVNYKDMRLQYFKDEAMKALQEKSFQGLYLRLQFWINQIYKRLQAKSNG